MEALTPLFGTLVSSEKWRKFVCTTRKVPSTISASQTFCFSTMQKKTNFSCRRCFFRTSGLVMQKRRIERCTQFRCGADGDIPEARKKKLAVFVSGGGSNFRSIHEGSVSGFINGEVALLVTDKSDCGGAKYATENDIPVLLFPRMKSSVDGISPVDLVASLRNYEIDFVLLAGYLKLIPNELVQAFPRSILNIHPSLLPAFGGKGYYGSKVHQAVIASGARYSGPTIHYVDEHYDTGRILAQRVVPVLADDTVDKLAKRVLHEEHKLYVEVVAALCEERIIWREDGVPLIRSKENPEQYS